MPESVRHGRRFAAELLATADTAAAWAPLCASVWITLSRLMAHTATRQTQRWPVGAMLGNGTGYELAAGYVGWGVANCLVTDIFWMAMGVIAFLDLRQDPTAHTR